ncbi:cytochrome c biogenesis protein DipZ [Bartonella sp. HY761]|uniref:cytochrome c biogenesis protein DipZ n=1 Tax=Bartonella sp. HY761 TaxID=2979330 RepID=UPI0021E23242|nr:cytochrome c biogenesis protein DipZ [Bartonella sp. HY761]UXN08046.1 cytochrome c biogenesis protein DipZ [Bartonella sp. HY761]
MLIFVIAYLGGVLTVISPCILPVLPFVFTRTGQPFMRSGLPMLLGMAISFAIVASLAAVAGGWVVAANQYGRLFALILLALFAITLLFPSLATKFAAPFVALGNRLSNDVDNNAKKGNIWGSALLGVATGLLWAPCAGPILGLILTGAAINGPNANTSILLLAYALGAITSLAVILLVGGRLVSLLKRSFGVTDWARRGLGIVVLLAVGAIASGLDTGYLTQVSTASTNALEQNLMSRFANNNKTPDNNAPNNDGASNAMMAANPAMMSANGAVDNAGNNAMSGSNAMMAGNNSMMMSGNREQSATPQLPIEGAAPDFTGATEWLNSPPLDLASLKGKVVLMDFWTYSCINCLRTIPYVRAWAEKYKDQGLVVIGVHSPEFAFERDVNNVKNAAQKLNVTYPVAVDNSYAIWRAYKNQYWPAHYFIDAKGQIRHHHFGEGDYEQSERVIQSLLAEAGHTNIDKNVVDVKATGEEAAPDLANVLSPETYIGFERAENFVSPDGMVENAPKDYSDGDPRLNEWGLNGNWTIGKENATLNSEKGSIVFRFHARDLHLVLGPKEQGKTIAFKVKIDGKAPENAHGSDVNENGEGVVKEQRLYQLIRQKEGAGDEDHLFEIEFMQPGIEAYAFTFG